jgi:hypothetical protein
VGYKIINISFDPIENYPLEIADCINYLGCFGSEQVLVEEDINIY